MADDQTFAIESAIAVYVQGVGFRMTAVAQARGLAFDGFVRNEADGSVQMDVEGVAADVKEVDAADRLGDAREISTTPSVESTASAGIESGFRIRALTDTCRMTRPPRCTSCVLSLRVSIISLAELFGYSRVRVPLASASNGC